MEDLPPQETIRTKLEVSLEGGLEPLLQIRIGEKLHMALEPGSKAEAPPCVRMDRWDGTPVGYLEAEWCTRFAPWIKHAAAPLVGTVVALAANRGSYPQPEVTVELSAPARGTEPAAVLEEAETDPGLIPVAGYPYPYPFTHFNPLQSAVFPLAGNGRNIVVSANTSAGKTIAAELVVDDTLARGFKVIYLSPFKALTEERYADWRLRYANRRLVIMTGDYELTASLQQSLREADIVLMTSEMLDSRTRKFESERNEWMAAVGLLVVDEAHILSTPRGDKVETGLMRFTRVCPQARLMLLSATVSNREEIGAWLTSLNGKPTDVVHKDWRPVKLEFTYVEHRVYRTYEGKLNYHRTENEKIELAIEQVLRKPTEKFLVFVHAKTTGSRLLSELKKRGVKVLYHNGDLDLEERAAIERSFKDRANGTRVLVSTGTTAWGVNLPARNVVVVGVTRGLQPVDELDIIQMAGRAGRYGIDDEGHVFLIVPEGSRGKWEQTFRKPRPVTSVLNDRRHLLTHVLAEIYTGQISRLSDVFTWYRRSLAHRQGRKPFSTAEVEEVLARLVELGMVRVQDDEVAITALGNVASVMYFPPQDIHAWRMNFNRLFAKGLEGDDYALAWALANVPSLAMEYLPAEWKGPALECDATLSERGLCLNRLNAPAVLAVHALLQGFKPDHRLHSVANRFRSDCRRILNTLRRIDETCAEWGRERFWDAITLRLTRKRRKTPAAEQPAGGETDSTRPERGAPLPPGMERRWVYADRDGRLVMTVGTPSLDGPIVVLTPTPLSAGAAANGCSLKDQEMVLVGTFVSPVGDRENTSDLEDIEKRTPTPSYGVCQESDEPFLDEDPEWSRHGRFESEDEFLRDSYGEAGWEDSEGNFFPESWSPE